MAGIGICMGANRFKGVRAGLCRTPEDAEMTRKHNNANVLNMGARIVSKNLAEKIVDKWLNTPFEGGRHADRLKFMANEVEKINFK